MRTYLTLIWHADDYTLMAPFGGAPTCRCDASSARLQAMERYVQAGEAELDELQGTTSATLER